MSSPKLAFVFVLGALVGCTDAPTVLAPSRISASDVTLSADREDGGDGGKQAVEGAAVFEPTDQGVSDVKYSVEAKQHKNGKVDGEFEMSLMRRGTREQFKGEIACFTVVGTDAHISARVERSSNPDVRVGDYLIFTVRDNDQVHGKGKPAPDQTSFFFLGNESLARIHCAVGLNVAMYPVVHGHFELRPETSGH